jgi:hypothetical protein
MRSFADFSDHDFELFVADLLGEIDGVRYEVFARGADGGIDLRHSPPEGEGADIVQCKRYIESSWSDLKRAARAEGEALAAMEPAPRSYRLVTTLPLTPDRKSDLAGILHGFAKTDGDIFGADDLETMLDRNPEVERRHPKLWLAGGTHLDEILNAGVYNRSRQLLEETKHALSRYVETDAFHIARHRLREERILIVAGKPGVGKTTLAQMLLADAVVDGYQPIEISADAEEANEAYRADERQVFYYDDFLGSTFLQQRLAKNEDRRLTQLIRRVAGSQTSLFLLSTREHILRQALEFYEELARERVNARRYLLELSEYTRLDRARIFYNHIWASGQLNQAATASLVDDAGYARIIDHPEYNPRLIEYITGLGSLELGEDENRDFLGFAVGVLDDPERIWRQAFENQLESAERGLLVVLASMQTEVTATDLETGFRAYCAAAGITLQGTLFHRSLRVLEGSFAEIRPEDGESLVVPANPSIVDFVAAWLGQAPTETLALYQGAAFFAQLEWAARSVLRRLEPGPIRTEQLAGIAAGVRRLFTGTDPRWGMMHFGSVHSPAVLAPISNAPCARLVFLVGLIGEAPELEEELGRWLEERIEEESTSWEERHIPNAAEPVGLVRALGNASRPTRTVAERAKQHLLDRLRSVYAWEQLIALREIEPDIFPLAEWTDLRNRFEGFAEDFTNAHDDIDEVEEVDSLISLGETMGVDLEPMEIEFVRDEVRRRISEVEEHLEAQQTDREPRRPGRHAGEAREIAALFGRLAEDGRG